MTTSASQDLAKTPLVLERLFPEHNFLADYWPYRVLVGDGPPERLADLLELPELASIEALLAAHRSGAKVVFSNQEGRYRQVIVQSSQAEILQEAGLSVCLTAVHSSIPAVCSWVERLAQELGLPAYKGQCNAYYSPKRAGFHKHFDDHEVLIVQIFGSKTWTIGCNTEIPFPLHNYVPCLGMGDSELSLYADSCSELMPDDSQTVEMRPGSVLFLPRGHWHQTESMEDSLSLTFGLYAPTHLELVEDWLRLRGWSSDRWRRPVAYPTGNLCRGLKPDEALELRRLLDELVEEIGDLSPEELAKAFPRTGPGRRKASPAESRPGSYRRHPDARVEIAAGKDGQGVAQVRFFLGEGSRARFEIDRDLTPIFQWIGTTEESFSLEAMATRFPGVPGDMLAEMLEALAETGVVMEEPNSHDQSLAASAPEESESRRIGVSKS